MALSDAAIRSAKAADKDRKLFDEKGLYLLVTSRGSKLWRFKYRFLGKEKKLALGIYPEVSLKEARARTEEARRQLADGIDPAFARKQAAVMASVNASNSFSAVAREFLDKMKRENRAESTLAKTEWLLSLLAPSIGERPVADITPHELLAALKSVERRGRLETARRLRAFASQIFRYAIATARADNDPAQMLRGALITPTPKHHAAILDAKAVGALLRAIDGYNGRHITIYALKLTPHVFQRPGEVRMMEWAEIDLNRGVWSIPFKRMKMRDPHLVPLSRQSVGLLREVQAFTGDGRYVFPGMRSAHRPLSENTINGALRRLGYSGDEMTAHGFRTTASSLLNESGKWQPDAIERALAHKDKNAIRGIYNRASYWDERVRMAQWWSDYLDTLKTGAELIPLRSTRVANEADL